MSNADTIDEYVKELEDRYPVGYVVQPENMRAFVKRGFMLGREQAQEQSDDVILATVREFYDDYTEGVVTRDELIAKINQIIRDEAITGYIITVMLKDAEARGRRAARG